MYADRAQQSAQVAQFGAIQLQRHNSGSARRCTSDNNRKVFVPMKMLPPPLTAWMKKRHYTPCLRIAGMRPFPFVAITAAGQGEIFMFL